MSDEPFNIASGWWLLRDPTPDEEYAHYLLINGDRGWWVELDDLKRSSVRSARLGKIFGWEVTSTSSGVVNFPDRIDMLIPAVLVPQMQGDYND